MVDTTALWPTPADLAPRESAGYLYRAGAFEEFPRLQSPEDLHPAGMLRSTVTDMARFMIAQLEDGRHADPRDPESRILDAGTVLRMLGSSWTPDPRLLGNVSGFFDFSDNGQRTLGHSGEAEPMQSLLLLLPDRDIGVFVSYNSMGGEGLTRQHLGFQRAFFDHYFPAPPLPSIPPPGDFAGRAGSFTGSYRTTRSARSTVEKFLSLMNPTVEVRNPGDGTLLLESPYGAWRLVEEGHLLFRQVDGPFHFAFREDDRGDIAYLFTDLTPMMAFERTRWYETSTFSFLLLAISSLVFLAMLAASAIRAILGAARGGHREPSPRVARIALRLVVAVCLLDLSFEAGNALWGGQPVFGITVAYKVVLGLGVMSVPLTIGAAILLLPTWKKGYWSPGFRLLWTIAVLASASFVWFLANWNLLGWRFQGG